MIFVMVYSTMPLFRKGRFVLTENSRSPMISVIVPVYNVEKYVGKCLSSLVEQTYSDFEIIAVNDGSSDNSLDILRHFEAKYDFIKVINQENRGVSAARNTAIKAACGTYIAMVDSDDYVLPTYLEELYNACAESGADIACCYYHIHYIDNDFSFEYPFRCRGILTREQAVNKLIRDIQIQSFLWNKLFKRNLFTDYGINFPTMCFEDMAVLNKVFLHANRVIVIDRPLYCYNQHSASTLAKINASKINDYLRAVALIRISLEQNGVYDIYKKSYVALTKRAFNFACMYVLRLHRTERCLRGFATNMNNVSRAIKYFAGDEFNCRLMMNRTFNIVEKPQKLEKDYSVR